MKDIANATFPALEQPEDNLSDSEGDSNVSSCHSDKDYKEPDKIVDTGSNQVFPAYNEEPPDIEDQDLHTNKGTSKEVGQQQRKTHDASQAKTQDRPSNQFKMDKSSKYHDVDILGIQLMSKKWFLDPLYTLISILSFGLLNIINNWSGRRLRNYLLYTPTTDVENATHVGIDTSSGKKVHSRITKKLIYVSEAEQMTGFAFSHNYQTYILNKENNSFQNLQEFYVKQRLADFLDENKDGKDDIEVASLQNTFGFNELLLSSISIWSRVFAILARPTATVKIFSLFVLGYLRYKLYIWFVIGYLIYQIITEIKAEKKVQADLQDAYYYNEKVLVIRNSKDGMHKKKIMDARDLVPGDLIEITDSLSIPADVILVHGSCIVEDSNSNSNKINRTKLPVDKSLDCSLSGIPNKNILVAGDKVIYTINHVNEGCFGIVLRTGFNTIRGGTLRTIAIPRVRKSIYMRDAYMLFTLFTILALITAIVLLIGRHFSSHSLSVPAFMTEICQLLIVVLKPAIPMALFSVTYYSVARLNAKNIKASDSNKLNDAGKTTTLLIEGDALANEDVGTAGFLVTRKGEDGTVVFDRMIKNPQKLLKTVDNMENTKAYIEACGVCHMVTKVYQENYGSALDTNMLAASGFEVSYNVKDNGVIERYLESKQQGFSSSYKIIKYFESSKSYPVTSVLVQNDKGETYLYSKGEPFMFERMCEKRSLPFTYSTMVAKCANKGFKSTALGFKKVDKVDLDRKDLESGLQFLGLFLSNTIMREEVEQTISKLNHSEIDAIVLSNDSVYLGLSHALNSGICSTTVYIARTMVINNVETVVWQCTQRNKEPSFSMSITDVNNLIDVDLSAEDLCKLKDVDIAVTGAAFRLLVDQPEHVKSSLLARCKVYANLTTTDRALVYNSLKGLLGTEPITYVTYDHGDINMINRADVSISLTSSTLSPIHSFSSLNGSISSLLTILQESRTSLFNRHKNFEFVCYFVILQYFGLLLLFSKNTDYAAAQVLFMDIFLLLVVSYLQSNLGPLKLTKEVPCRSILSRKFLSSTLTLTSYGIVLMWLLMTLLWKSKFYQHPKDLINAKSHSMSSKHIFYDPFVVFIFFVYLNVRFIISNNTSILFSKKILKHIGFLLYTLFLMFVPFALLFVNDIHSPTLKKVLKLVFKIPDLRGFELLVLGISVAMLVGFYVIKWIEKRYIRTLKLRGGDTEGIVSKSVGPTETSKNMSLVDKSRSSLKKEVSVRKSGLSKSLINKIGQREFTKDLSVSMDTGKVKRQRNKWSNGQRSNDDA